MIWQSVMVILLGCALIGNPPIAAVSFSRPVARNGLDITDGEELLQALEFLDRYEGARRATQGNMITDDYPFTDDDYELLPYDELLTQDRFTGNDLPPLPPYNQDYPMLEQQVDPYDLELNTGLDYPMVGDRSLTLGERMNQDWAIRQVVNRLFEDAVMEEMLREDAAAATDLLDIVEEMEEEREDDGEDLEGFVDYSEQPEISNSEFDAGSDVGMPSFVLDDDYSNQEEPAILESFADYSESVGEDDGIDEGLLEAVILKLTEAQMKEKLLEDEGIEDEEDLIIETSDSSTSQETDDEIDNFVAQIMSELLDGSEDLANKLVSEIEQEGDMLDEEDDEVLEQGEGEDTLGGVVFGDGWGPPTQDIELYDEPVEDESSCPALDIILDDCMVVDEFPGLGDGGYKYGFGESCNRHQLCYFCSGSFEIPTSLCDETYKMELMSICNGDEECGFRAKYFWLSALASRDPTPVDLDVCRQPCVVAYLLDN